VLPIQPIKKRESNPTRFLCERLGNGSVWKLMFSIGLKGGVTPLD